MVFQSAGIDDRLTGFYNRPFLEKPVGVECARAQRSGTILSLLLVGLDDFQAYTDRYGHPAGGDALRLVARVEEGVRTRDLGHASSAGAPPIKPAAQ